MNAHGKARRTASIVGTLAALLLAHTAGADEVVIVSGKRMDKPEASEPARTEPVAAEVPVALADEIRASIHEELRDSLRENLETLGLEADRTEGAASEVKVATLTPPTGV
jgi:hypothetical protein